MKKKYVIALTIIGVLIAVLGLSYAYFASNFTSKGAGSSITVETVELGDVGFVLEGTIEFKDLDIYPGHKNVSALKVTANGQNRIVEYNLVWEGTNTINTPLKYYVYKIDTKETPSIECTKKEEGNVINKKLYEECTNNNFDNLGSIISTGSITKTDITKTFNLVENEVIKGTPEGSTVYYYVVLEYPNLDEPQNIDMGGTFKGLVTVKKIESDNADITIAKVFQQNKDTYQEVSSTPKEGYILNEEKSTCSNNATPKWNNNNVLVTNLTTSGTECNLYYDRKPITIPELIASKNKAVRTDFSTTLTENTTGTVFTAEDNDGTTYYYAGDVKDNWVKFAGFYWRIIRVNGDGSLRLIYSGDNKSGPVTTGEGTQIGKSTFNSIVNDNMYVGFMYTTNQLHGTGTPSTIKGILDTWYDNNLKDKSNYLDNNAGFCGDRQPSTATNIINGSGGTGATNTYYGAYIRLVGNKTPDLKCKESSDNFKTPVGLITADEVAYAGAVNGQATSGYYLHTGQVYWTLSPYSFNSSNSYAHVFDVTGDGNLRSGYVNLTNGVRPTINLKADVSLTGTGTSLDPYQPL